jgi:hypothetical protein
MATSGKGTSPISVASGRTLDSCDVRVSFGKPASTPDRVRGRIPLAAYYCRPTLLRFLARESQPTNFVRINNLPNTNPRPVAEPDLERSGDQRNRPSTPEVCPLQLISESGNRRQRVTGAGNAPEGTGMKGKTDPGGSSQTKAPGIKVRSTPKSDVAIDRRSALHC